MAPGCSQYSTRNDFTTYISQLLLPDGSLNTTVATDCRDEICVAIWGDGNPDISGQGMIVGYVLDHIIGVGLAAFAMIRARAKRQSHDEVSRQLLKRYHDCAAFLCFSIQIAALIFLIKEEAGVSTTGMGDGSVRITEAVSVLTLLPLLHAVVVSSARTGVAANKEEAEDETKTAEIDSKSQKAAPSKRFGMLVVCWLLAFFPFYCKMNNAFGPSQIGAGGAISSAQFQAIEDICLADVTQISAAEDGLMSALIILAYIPLSLYVLWTIIFMALEKHHSHSRIYRRLERWNQPSGRRGWLLGLPTVLLCSIPLLACGLLWSIIRVQHFQTQLSNSSGADDADNQWTFGQVVASTVFAPVLLDCCLAVKEGIDRSYQRGQSTEGVSGNDSS